MNRFDWTWDMRGDGPHYFLELNWSQERGVRMQAQARTALARSFESQGSNDEGEGWMTTGSSEWSYLEVVLSPERLCLTRGWGYSRGQEEDFQFLNEFALDGKGVERWRIQAGGDGYSQIYIASGWGWDEFAAYCRGERKKEASLEEVEATLRSLLNEPDAREQYVLGERTDDASAARWPVRFKEPLLHRDWKDKEETYQKALYRHSLQLEERAETLCDVCHVRASKSGFVVDSQTQLMHAGHLLVRGHAQSQR